MKLDDGISFDAPPHLLQVVLLKEKYGEFGDCIRRLQYLLISFIGDGVVLRG